MRDVRRVLGSSEVAGDQKRNAVGMVIEKVIGRADGADVHFQPGLFPGTCGPGKDQGLGGGKATDGGKVTDAEKGDEEGKLDGSRDTGQRMSGRLMPLYRQITTFGIDC